MSQLYSRIYAVVRQIETGQVSTYGQISAILGGACTPRQVGYAMAALTDDTVPWHRVINSKGEVSDRGGAGASVQRQMLQHEGVEFNDKGRVDFNKAGWRGPSADWLNANNCFPAPPPGKKGNQLSLF